VILQARGEEAMRHGIVLFIQCVLSVAASTPAAPPLILEGDGSKPMPSIGFGTCCRKSAKGPRLVASTREFLQQGGRLIDTAQMYDNHRDLALAIHDSGVPREELWLTSKVNTKVASTRAAAVQAVEQSLGELNVTYLDLMLIHGLWTISMDQALDVWQGLLDCKRRGLIRHAGVSNFGVAQLERLIASSGVKPAAVQTEFHPWASADAHAVVAFCHRHAIAVTAYGSLGSSSNRAKGDAVAEVAKAHGVAPAAVLLRWALNRKVAVIPGATTKQHIKANLNLPPLTLTSDELSRLGATSARPAKFRSWGNLPKGDVGVGGVLGTGPI